MVSVETNLLDFKLKDQSERLSLSAKHYFSTVKVTKNTTQCSIEKIRDMCQGVPICNLNEAITLILEICQFRRNMRNEKNILQNNFKKNLLYSWNHWEECFASLPPLDFCEIFINHCIFIPLQNHTLSYIQISGSPISSWLLIKTHPNVLPDVLSTFKLAPLHNYTIERKGLFEDSGVTRSIILNDELCSNEDLLKEIFHHKMGKKTTIKMIKRLQLGKVIDNCRRRQLNLIFSRHISSFQIPVSQATYSDIPHLLSCSTPIQEVMNFVKSLMTLFPDDPWWSSCHRNKRLIIRVFFKILTYKKIETLSIRQIISGIKVSEFSLLRSTNATPHRPHPSTCEQIRAEAMLCLMLKWFIEMFLLPVLKTSFKVMEHKGEVVYYGRSIWKTITDLSLKDLISKKILVPTPKEVVDSMIKSNTILGTSGILFNVKPSDLRVINTLGRTSGGKLPINSRLKKVLAILQFEVLSNPSLKGCRILSIGEVYGAWKELVTKLKDSKLQLYMFSCDVQSCFDNVDLNRLLEVVEGILTQKEYVIMTYVIVKRIGKTYSRQIYKRVVVKDASVSLAEYFSSSASNLPKNSILVNPDYTCYYTVKKQEVMSILRKHLLSNIVKIKDSYYHKTNGIPQGSILSDILISIYYGAMELKHFKVVENAMIVRFVDDYLIAAAHERLLLHAYDLMSNGIDGFRFFINEDKTQQNFQILGFDHLMFTTEWFPWCGLLFQTKPPFNVKADYSRYFKGINGHVASKCHLNPFKNFTSSLKVHNSLKCLPILMDSACLSTECVSVNVYEHFLIVGMKFHCLLRKFASAKVIGSSSSYLMSCILDLGRNFYNNVKSSCNNEKYRLMGSAGYPLTYHVTIWLLLCAFREVLQRKQTNYKVLLRTINRKITILSNNDGLQIHLETLEEIVKRDKSSLINRIKY